MCRQGHAQPPRLQPPLRFPLIWLGTFFLGHSIRNQSHGQQRATGPTAQFYEMPEPSLPASASLLRPLVTSVFRNARHLHAERQAGQVPSTQPSPIMDDLLTETLDRIRGGNINSSWWQSLLAQFGQQYIAPDFLRKPALREWLAEEQVANDLKAIATWRIVGTAQDEAAHRDRLAQSYSNRTGEALYLAAGPIDVVVAILVAGYLGSVPPEQRAITGILQTGISQFDDRLDRLSQAISPAADPFTRQAHTGHAGKELARILVLRALDPDRSRSEIRKLHDRINSGDLVAADCRTKRDVRYWTARLCANDAETLDVAKELRARISDDEPSRDLSIVAALIAEMDGNTNGAVQLLRDHDDPDSRTALFGVFARSHDAHTALDLFADRMDAADAGFFTAVGWRNWAFCMSEVGRWQEAAERLAKFDDTWSDAPALAFVEGIINSQLLLPTERRSASASPQLFAGISPNQGEQAETVHARATACFELAQSGSQEFEDADLERFIADSRRWLRLMDPIDEKARNARDEVQQGLESGNPDVNLMPFAWAFGVSFNPAPLHQYLAGRERLGGLNDGELQAEFFLMLTIMNSGEMSGRDFLGYLGTRQTRLADLLPSGLVEVVSIEALVTDNQAERARALLSEIREDLDDHEVSRLSAMIDAHEGLDPRKDLERTYRETGSITDLPKSDPLAAAHGRQGGTSASSREADVPAKDCRERTELGSLSE